MSDQHLLFVIAEDDVIEDAITVGETDEPVEVICACGQGYFAA